MYIHVQAAQCGTKQIDEDGLLELLRTLPAKKTGLSSTASAKSKRPAVKKSKSATASPGTEGGVVASPPKKSVSVVTTPTRGHVTTPVLSVTPSSSLVTPTASVASPQVEGNAHLFLGPPSFPPSLSFSLSHPPSFPPWLSLSSSLLPSLPPSLPPASESLLWVDKYRPKSLKNIIGQQGEKSNARKLLKWLQDWEKNRTKGGDGGRKGGGGGGGSGDFGQGDGGRFRAALLSGPPGVGKTTTAVLVCKVSERGRRKGGGGRAEENEMRERGKQ